MPGMAVVGERFKCDEIFVPEMLISANAMKAALAILEPLLAASGTRPAHTAVIGTVEGDLHDIGKNLVAMMWKGANIEVIDLGVNVSPAAFVSAVETHRPQIVGMSALLTTTMPRMRNAVAAVKASGSTGSSSAALPSARSSPPRSKPTASHRMPPQPWTSCGSFSPPPPRTRSDPPMSMFSTYGTSGSDERKPDTLAKLERLRKTFAHEEPDRVAISDFFWGGFRDRWRRELGLPADTDPYYHYDLDFIVTVPNMDPHVRPFETIREDDEEVVVKTGFETTIRKRFDLPMPEQVSWETDTIEKMEAFEFDDPADRRRYFEAGDNQIAGVGDGFERNSPPWVETVRSLHPDFPVYGSITETGEITTRLLGQLNTLTWIGEYPERFGEQLLRIGEFSYQVAKAQIEAAAGLLDGLVIWGDVAYRKGLFMGPTYWRKYFKPTVARIIEVAH